MGPKKKFDQKAYEKYDRAAKEAIHGWMTKSKFYSKILEEDGHWDGICRTSSFWEAEVKANWGDYPFPFSTVHIPMRKVRRLAESDGTMVTFFVVNNKFNRAVYVLSPVVLQSPIVVVPNSEVKDGEEFADVPFGDCVEVCLA